MNAAKERAQYEASLWAEGDVAQGLIDYLRAARRTKAQGDAVVQRATSTTALDAIASRLEPDLRSVFLAAVRAARDATDIDRIAALLLSGAIDPAAAASGIAQLEASLGNLTPIIQAGFLGGGEYAAQALSRAGLSISFDLAHPRAVEWAQRYAGDLITSVSEETRMGVRALIAESIDQGIYPLDTAKQIKELVGLTVRQQEAVASKARELHEQGLDPETVERRTQVYANEQLAYRADMIARTETLSAVNHGQDELWRQAREQNLLPADTKREWVVTPRKHRIPPCEAICEPMAGQRVALHEPFITPEGAKVTVPPAHPHCRCTVRLIL